MKKHSQLNPSPAVTEANVPDQKQLASMSLDSNEWVEDQKHIERPAVHFDSEISAFKHFFYGQSVDFFNESDAITLASIRKKVTIQRGSLIACFTTHAGASCLVYLNSELEPVTLPLRAEQLAALQGEQGPERLEAVYAIAQAAHQGIDSAQPERQGDQKAAASVDLPAFYFPMFGLQDATLTLLVGATGSGKSTLINHLLGASITLEEGVVSYQFPEQEYCATSEQHISCTTSPKIYQHGRHYYCDLPGSGDTRGDVMDKMAQSSINFLIQSAKSIKLVFVIEEGALTVGRAVLLKKAVHASKQIISFIEKAGGNRKIMTVITKSNGQMTEGQVRSNMARSLAALSNEIEHEQSQLIKLKNQEGSFLDRFRGNEEALLTKKVKLAHQIALSKSRLSESVMAKEFLTLLQDQPIVISDITAPSASLRAQMDGLDAHQPAPDFFMKHDVQHALFQAGGVFEDSIQKLLDLSSKRMRKTQVLADIQAKKNEQAVLISHIDLLKKTIASFEGKGVLVSALDLDQDYLNYLKKMEQLAKRKYETKKSAFSIKSRAVDKLIDDLKAKLGDSLEPIVEKRNFNDPRYAGWGSGLVRGWVSSWKAPVEFHQRHTRYEISTEGKIEHTLTPYGKHKQYDFSEKEQPSAPLLAEINTKLSAAEQALMRAVFSEANYEYSGLSGHVEANSADSYRLKVTFIKEPYIKNIFSFKRNLSDLKTARQERNNARAAMQSAQAEYEAAKKKRMDYENSHVIPPFDVNISALHKELNAKEEELKQLVDELHSMNLAHQDLEATIDQLAFVLHAPAQVLWFRLFLAFYSVYEAQHQNKRVRNDQARLSRVPYVPAYALAEVRRELQEFLGIDPSVEAHRCVTSIEPLVDLERKASDSSLFAEPVGPWVDVKANAPSVAVEPALLPDYETAVSVESPVGVLHSVLPAPVDEPVFDEKAPHITHVPCGNRVDSYYYLLALLIQSGVLTQSTDCPHANCDEPITINQLAGSMSPAHLAIIAQSLAGLPSSLQAKMNDPYDVVRQAVKQSQGDGKSICSSLPKLLQPFASRLGKELANSADFYMQLLRLFNASVDQGVSADLYLKAFFSDVQAKAYQRMMAGSEFRFSDLSHSFYSQELQVLANLFALHIAVIADGREPVIVSPHEATDTPASADMPSLAYLVLYYETQGKDFSYRQLAFSADVELSVLFSRIADAPFTLSGVSAPREAEETLSRRSSWVPAVDSIVEPAPPVIGAEVNAGLKASLLKEQVDLKKESESESVADNGLRLTRQVIPDDGHCFFSAVAAALSASHLTHAPSTQQAVRDAIATWASDLSADSPVLQGRTQSDYQAAVATNLWGGEPEFRAVADIYGMPLVVLSSGERPALYRPQAERSAVLTGPVIFLEYADHHYNVLRLSDPSQSGRWFAQIQDRRVPDLAVWLHAPDLLARTPELDSWVDDEPEVISASQTLIWGSNGWVPAVVAETDSPLISTEVQAAVIEQTEVKSEAPVPLQSISLASQGSDSLLSLATLGALKNEAVRFQGMLEMLEKQGRSIPLDVIIGEFAGLVPVVILESGVRPVLYLGREVRQTSFAGPAVFIAHSQGRYDALTLSDPKQSAAWFAEIKDSVTPDLSIWLAKENIRLRPDAEVHDGAAPGLQLARHPADSQESFLSEESSLITALIVGVGALAYAEHKAALAHHWSGRALTLRACSEAYGPIIFLDEGAQPECHVNEGGVFSDCQNSNLAIFIAHHEGEYYLLTLSDPAQAARWFAQHEGEVIVGLGSWIDRQKAVLNKAASVVPKAVSPSAGGEPDWHIVSSSEVVPAISPHQGVISQASLFAHNRSHAQAESGSLGLNAAALGQQ